MYGKYGKWEKQETKKKREKSLRERVAYLQGLAAGMNFQGQESGDRIFSEVLEVLGEAAGQIENLGYVCRRLEAYMECLDEDVEQIWEQMREGRRNGGGNGRRQRGEATVEVTCGRCGETVVFDASMLDGEEDEAVEVFCPLCGEVVFVSELPQGGDGARAESWNAGAVPGSTGAAGGREEEVPPVTDAGMVVKGPEVESIDTEGMRSEGMRRGGIGRGAEERGAGTERKGMGIEEIRQMEGMKQMGEMKRIGEVGQIEQMRRREQTGTTAAGIYDI